MGKFNFKETNQERVLEESRSINYVSTPINVPLNSSKNNTNSMTGSVKFQSV